MSKIITRLTDDQLEELFQNYSFENILEEYPDDFPYWIIPKLLALGNIELSEYNACFTDRDGYVYSRSYGARHLMQFTGLTPQEYFDLLVLHINDTEDRPKCDNPECRTPLKWSGRITAGYGSGGHRWDESPYHYCCRECAAKMQYERPDWYPNTAEFVNSGGTFAMMMEDPEDWCDKMIRSRRSNFLNQGKPDDICWFYVTWTKDNNFKFGISSDLKLRKSYSNFIDEYINPHIIKEGTRLKLADAEANIKRNLNQYCEYIPNTNIELIRKFWKLAKIYL